MNTGQQRYRCPHCGASRPCTDPYICAEARWKRDEDR
jgi:transposase-like protein